MYNRNLVFAAACLGMLLFGIVFLSLGSVNNMLAERFHLDDNGIGTLTALLPFGILAGSLIFGPIVDRFGYKWLLIVCALLVMAGLEGMALANSKGLIQIFVFLIGFGGGVLNGATNALAADVRRARRQAEFAGRLLRHRRVGHAEHPGSALEAFLVGQHRLGDRGLRPRAGALLPAHRLPAAQAEGPARLRHERLRDAQAPDLPAGRLGAGHPKRHGRHVQRLDDALLQEGDPFRP